MDYADHYGRLIERAKCRVLSGYSERHHIIPRCLGGSNAPENIVLLTGEEHFVAHQLLVKIYPSNHRLVWALSAMTHRTGRMGRPSNKRYGWLRRKFAQAMRERFEGKPLNAEHRAKLSAAAKRRKRQPHSDEARAKMSAAAKGRPKSAEHSAAMSAAKLGKKYGPCSPERAKNISAALKKSDKFKESRLRVAACPEYRAKQSAKMKEIWAARKHEKTGGVASPT